MKFHGAINFWIYLEYEVEMNQGFIGVCAREGVEERGSWREKRGTSVLWVLVWSRFERAREELICIVISLVPSSKLSLLPTKKKNNQVRIYFLGSLIQA